MLAFFSDPDIMSKALLMAYDTWQKSARIIQMLFSLSQEV